MAGGFRFARSDWSASSWTTFYVMEFLAERAVDPAVRDEIRDFIDNNVPMLNLAGPDAAPLVDVIAKDILRELPPLTDSTLQQSFDLALAELVDCAYEQQDYNRNPGGPDYYRLGPFPAWFFDLGALMAGVQRHLQDADSVRIDVRYYSAAQRAAIRDHLAALADSRVSIMGDVVGHDGS